MLLAPNPEGEWAEDVDCPKGVEVTTLEEEPKVAVGCGVPDPKGGGVLPP